MPRQLQYILSIGTGQGVVAVEGGVLDGFGGDAWCRCISAIGEFDELHRLFAQMGDHGVVDHLVNAPLAGADRVPVRRGWWE
jgi:hypothetical protein